jgi:hypothetical protein
MLPLGEYVAAIITVTELGSGGRWFVQTHRRHQTVFKPEYRSKQFTVQETSPKGSHDSENEAVTVCSETLRPNHTVRKRTSVLVISARCLQYLSVSTLRLSHSRSRVATAGRSVNERVSLSVCLCISLGVEPRILVYVSKLRPKLVPRSKHTPSRL